MGHDVFISYSRSDSEYVVRVCNALENRGISYFLDKEDIHGGQNDFTKVITNEVMDCKVFLLIGSKHSFASDWVEREIHYCVTRKQDYKSSIFPLITDNAEIPPHIEFELSKINCRFLSDGYSIENDLAAEVEELIKHPGIGLSKREFQIRKDKKLLYWLIALALLMLAAMGTYLYIDSSETGKARKSVHEFNSYLEEFDKSISELRVLHAVGDYESNFMGELAILNHADSLITSAQALKESFSENRNYSMFPNSDIVRKSQVQAIRDSMFLVWKTSALNAYRYFLQTGFKAEQQISVIYAERAESILPGDPEVAKILDKVN